MFNDFSSIAFKFPSLSAPTLTSKNISCLLLEPTKVSLLVNTNFAGLPVFIVTNAVNISVAAIFFPPNPPPILGLITLIFEDGIPNTFLSILFTLCGDCNDETTTILSFISLYEYDL